jgi:hypothetical protein
MATGELLPALDERGIAAYIRMKENPNGRTASTGKKSKLEESLLAFFRRALPGDGSLQNQTGFRWARSR